MSNENIILPAMSDQMTEAELLTWKVNIGDEVKKGDVIESVVLSIDAERERISLGLKPGRIATINLHSSSILFGSFHVSNCLRESLPIR